MWDLNTLLLMKQLQVLSFLPVMGRSIEGGVYREIVFQPLQPALVWYSSLPDVWSSLRPTLDFLRGNSSICNYRPSVCGKSEFRIFLCHHVEPDQVIYSFIICLVFLSIIENRVLNSLNVELPVYPFILSIFTS